jgi:hypothetical protein
VRITHLILMMSRLHADRLGGGTAAQSRSVLLRE